MGDVVNLRDTWYVLRPRPLETLLDPTGEPNSFTVTQYIDEIVAVTATEDEILVGEEKKEVVGYVGGYRLNAEYALNTGQWFTLFEGTDCLDADLHDACCQVYKVDEPDYREQLGDLLLGDTLYISDLELRRAHRGDKVGLRALWWFIHCYGQGCSIIMINAAPLQFVRKPESKVYKDLELHLFPQDEKRALTRLVNYYALLGFEPLHDGWMFINTELVGPTFEEIFGSDS